MTLPDKSIHSLAKESIQVSHWKREGFMLEREEREKRERREREERERREREEREKRERRERESGNRGRKGSNYCLTFSFSAMIAGKIAAEVTKEVIHLASGLDSHTQRLTPFLLLT